MNVYQHIYVEVCVEMDIYTCLYVCMAYVSSMHICDCGDNYLIKPMCVVLVQ